MVSRLASPTSTVIRPHVLSAYYEATFGRGAGAAQSVDAAFADATFDEFLALMRTVYPELAPRTAARMTRRADLRAIAESFPEAPPTADPEYTLWDLDGALIDAAKKTPPRGADAVVLKGIKRLRSFDSLSRVKHLRWLWARMCAPAFDPPARRLAVDEIDLAECKPDFTRSLLQATSALRLSWMEYRGAVDLACLAGHDRLTSVWAHGSWVRNPRALRGRRLKELALGRVKIDGALRELLASTGPSLRLLDLVSADDIAPGDLPFDAMTRLERVKLCVHPTHRAAWIALALARPAVRFDFGPPPMAQAKLPEIDVVETHRGVDILSLTKGTKVRYRLECNVAEEVGYPESNGDLEDDLAPFAKAAHKKIDWGSEADTLVATCSDVATCRWVIDTAIERAGAMKRKTRRKRS
jgi:hypothetical protein